MAICAACRVRHLKCDNQSPCTECKNGDRECLRINVRFRNLVCPPKKTTRADHNKYDFFFEDRQPWVDTQGQLRFVADGDDSAETTPVDEPENNVFNVIHQDTKLHQASMGSSSSASVPASALNATVTQSPFLDKNLPTYSIVPEHVSSNSPEDTLLNSTAGTSIYSPMESPRPNHQASDNTGLSSSRIIPSVPQSPWPLTSLQEGKLFQHFITYLAPWVCSNLLGFVNSD